MRQFRLLNRLTMGVMLGLVILVAASQDSILYAKMIQLKEYHYQSTLNKNSKGLQITRQEIRPESMILTKTIHYDGNARVNIRTDQKQEASEKYQTVKVVATGYTAGYESTGKHPDHPSYGITYSGVKVRRDKNAISTIAADLKVFPLGTILYIPGYGYGVVADKGSAIKGNKIDLYFKTTKQVYKEWGKKEVEVQVIRKGTGKLTEEMFEELGKALEVNKEIPTHLGDQDI